jgi:hypothetical protein
LTNKGQNGIQIIQAIPTYSMSVFLLPKELCRALNSMMQNFWWGHKENNSKIHWMSWEKLGTSKSKGRDGISRFIGFQSSALGKTGLENPSKSPKLVSTDIEGKILSERICDDSATLQETFLCVAEYLFSTCLST